jgi:pimeloyl-ACP methyl ester carboxylesterase
MEIHMPLKQVTGLSLYYEIHGRGFPLLLIRGVGSNADHWYSQVPALAAGYQVITFDNRGIGRSTDPGGPFTIQDLAGDTLGLLNALEIEQTHILGLSMGGMVAQELAVNHPGRVKGLILACTHPGGTNQIKADDEVESIFKEMVQTGSPESKVKAASALFDPRTLAERPEVAAEYAEISLRYPAGPGILIRQWEAVLAHNAYSRLSRIQSPTLVLTGDADVLVPPGNSTILADKIPGASLVVIPGGGHQVLVEQPDLCNQAILGFLKKM